MADLHFDLFVIGAGSGGVRAARLAAQTGLKVGIAEEYRVGGTCVIRGCVPKKLFVYASHYNDHFEDAAGFGHQVPQTRFDWPTLIENKDREIDRLNGIYLSNLEKAGVEVFQSRAAFVDDKTLTLTQLGKTVTADTFLIATGGTPTKPEDVPGIEHAITSNEAFHLNDLPRRVAVVGGGYIAVEFAGIFNGMGSNTTLLYRGEEILRGFDDDLRSALHDEMTTKGIDVRVNTNVTLIEQHVDGLHITLTDGSIMIVDQIMYATGRKPLTDGLGCDKASIDLAPNGAVLVDDYSRTNQPHIWAVGDVTDRMALTPVAIREGVAFIETRYKDNPTKPDHMIVPTAVFSQPPLGTTGMTEAEARDHTDGAVDVYISHFRPMKHTLSGRNEKMLMKLLVDRRDDKVLGLHIMGDEAGEMIQLAGIAVKMGATKADFDATCAVHPTAAEELVTMATPTR
ncbi:MAG: glutathione-disulfide reductase [Alphaproteobacteria bacterium]